MRLKSYFAQSVGDAIERARTELGPEAMLLNSRKTTPEQNSLGAYEVVFGITDELPIQRQPSSPIHQRVAPRLSAAKPVVAAAMTMPSAPLAEKKRDVSQTDVIAQELSELRKQIQVVSQSLANGLDGRFNGPRKASGVDRLFSRLLAFDFSEELSRDLIRSVAQPKISEFEAILRDVNGSEPLSQEPSSKAVSAELESRFEVNAEVGRPGAARRVVLFVGPPGAGKTTSVVKLAVQLGLERKMPLHLLSLDTVRVGGSEQLGAFGRILNVGFTALHTTAALAEELHDHQDKKLVLIDSPGYAAADSEELERTAAFFRDHPEIEVQLVLPATLRMSALLRFSQRFSYFEPSKLLYTHLDEVDTCGPLLENAMTAKLPISFLADGQSIPQDLSAATKTRLTDGLFGNARAALSAA